MLDGPGEGIADGRRPPGTVLFPPPVTVQVAVEERAQRLVREAEDPCRDGLSFRTFPEISQKSTEGFVDDGQPPRGALPGLHDMEDFFEFILDAAQFFVVDGEQDAAVDLALGSAGPLAEAAPALGQPEAHYPPKIQVGPDADRNWNRGRCRGRDPHQHALADFFGGNPFRIVEHALP